MTDGIKKQDIRDIIVKGARDLTEDQIRKTIEAYSQNAANYAKMWVWNPAYRQELSTQVKKFSRFVESGAKVLVPGAGVGRDVEMLVDDGFECTAFDISTQVLEESKSRGVKAMYFVHDVRSRLPFDDGSFDAVYADSVLEHVPKKEVRRVLGEFRRVLAARGILYAGVKKGDGEIYFRYDVGSDQHRRFYTTYNDVEFHQLLADTGYVLLEFWIDEHMDRKTHQWLAGIFRKS